ncbi:MAG: hypothetical protein GXP23_06470 [Gammaproteobacteria bacterium]|nr:hypothetical protein [Gammaproteobacteria bacterium]
MAHQQPRLYGQQLRHSGRQPRHSGAGRNPAVSTTYWIPGQARHDDAALTG